MRCDMCMKEGPVRQISFKVYGENDLAVCESCEKLLIATIMTIGSLTANAYKQGVDEVRKHWKRRA